MLVLSRRLNEKIIFPESNTMVQVVGMKPGVVRLGVRAPAEVTVLRHEVHERDAEWRPPQAPAAGDSPPAASAKGDGERAWLTSASLGLGLARLQCAWARCKTPRKLSPGFIFSSSESDNVSKGSAQKLILGRLLLCRRTSNMRPRRMTVNL